MAFIDLVRWVPDEDENIFAWRFPHTNLSTMTQLIVQESQEAIFFSKGQIVGKFGPGKHTLSTENMPLLRSLYGIPFGGKNPFTAEVWFVNKVQVYNLQWHTDTMSVHDADYNTHIPLRASGQYGLKVVDAERFLIKAVGTKSEFSEDDLTAQFVGEFTTKAKSIIMQHMLENRIGFKQISAHLNAMSELLRVDMSAFWAELGIELTKFYVSTIEIDSSTMEGRRVKEAIAKQSEMSITGRTWQQEQMFETTNNAIEGMTSGFSNMSGGGGLIGGLMAMNMMQNMGNSMNAGGAMQGMMQPQYNQPSFGGQQQMGGQQSVRMVHCSNCATRFPSTSRFCPKCGDPYNPCPKCGTDNDLDARRCISCGAQLMAGGGAANNCPQCNSPVVPGAAFCGSCGARLVSSNVCGRCGTTMAPGTKFCPACGFKNA
jgi:membrane protease subunit (stomatin/prohibitin family)